MTKELKEKFPDVVLKNVYEILSLMRQIKKPEEIEALKKACEITNEGFRALLGFIRPGLGEWQIEGFLSNEFIGRGARKFSFLPIIASGKDTCVLHYIQNSKRCEDGALVLMDIGTEYGNYNSDMTRTVPVNGKFTPRQRAVYESVLNMMTYAKSILRPGILKSEYERLVRVFAAGNSSSSASSLRPRWRKTRLIPPLSANITCTDVPTSWGWTCTTSGKATPSCCRAWFSPWSRAFTSRRNPSASAWKTTS